MRIDVPAQRAAGKTCIAVWPNQVHHGAALCRVQSMGIRAPATVRS